MLFYVLSTLCYCTLMCINFKIANVVDINILNSNISQVVGISLQKHELSSIRSEIPTKSCIRLLKNLINKKEIFIATRRFIMRLLESGTRLYLLK